LIEKDVLDLLPNRAINLHTSLLPWNRGAYPNLWSFLDDTPKGITIHLMDERIDIGNILLQKEVYIQGEKETLSSSYKFLHREIQELFISNWDKMKNFQISQIPQMNGGSVHYIKDFDKIKSILGDDGWNIKIPDLKKRFMKILQETR
jgi:methionyl-tRNA formyltransferase